MPERDAIIDPTTLARGMVLRHQSGGTVVLDRRKSDGSGWWNTDGSGLADHALVSGQWTLTGEVMALPAERVAGRCATHDDLAWRHSDGSITCMHALIVETSSRDCEWAEMPTDWLQRRAEGSHD